jgi:hypothetical protein
MRRTVEIILSASGKTSDELEQELKLDDFKTQRLLSSVIRQRSEVKHCVHLAKLATGPSNTAAYRIELFLSNTFKQARWGKLPAEGCSVVVPPRRAIQTAW